MYNSHLVILTSDTDCDGTGYGAHRVAVPTSRRLEFLNDHRAAIRHAIESEQVTGMSDAYDVISIQEFYAQYGANLDTFDRVYFATVGYTSGHIAPNWNPWVYDDSIGIPALDHTNDPPVYSDDDILY